MAKTIGTCIHHGLTEGYAYGKFWNCKTCHVVAARKWMAKNPDKVKAIAERQHAKNRKGPRPIRAECSVHGAATIWKVYSGRRRCVACTRKWANDHAKRYRARNLEKCKAAALKSAKAWALAHPERVRESHRRSMRRKPWRAAVRTGNHRAKKSGSHSDGSVAKYWPMILKAYRGRCAYCGQPGTGMDHVVPLRHGGKHVAANVRPVCLSCNQKKHLETWTPRPWAAMVPSVDLDQHAIWRLAHNLATSQHLP